VFGLAKNSWREKGMKHLIVGTAGHVDHGKTALIRLLTGTDTDRLKEEKARGISIDIGFAALHYPEKLTLGIVDVPGHERFLKNMLAGTGGIDMAMLVIAADEGIMPQTREHFEMLQCFGVKHGLVVLNKIDKVDSEWLTLMEEEIRTYLGKTFLGQAPICRVSAINGEGIEALRKELYLEAQKVSARDREAPFRLWIDRAFNIKGQGLIVTGSVMSGSLQTGAGLTLYPAASPIKVRGIESHNQEITEVGAGQRASLKLAGTGLAEVGRGMFLSEEGYCLIGSVWEAAIQWKQAFPSGTRIRLHIGTGEFIGRLSFRKKPEQSETPILARLHMENPIAAAFGDQGLLRRFSPQDLIGGVTLLTLAEVGSRRQELLEQLTEAYRKLDYQAVLLSLLLLCKNPVTQKEWQQSAGYINGALVKAAISRLLEQGKVKKAGNYYLASETLAELETAMKREVEAYHRLHSTEPGISRETLRQKIKLPANIADWFLQYASENCWIVPRGEFVASPSHANRHGGSMDELKAMMTEVLPVNELTDITPQGLAEKMNRPLEQIKPFFEQMVREKVFIRLSGVHVYSNTMQYIGTIIQRHFRSHETLSVGEIRDLLNTSRRMVIPVMEYCDSNKYTLRKGDTRFPGPALKNFSE
jgi:selenocysteine-specific elongation factor